MIDLRNLHFIGSDLHRPECVLATKTGNLYVSDWRGGVTMIRPDGTQHLFLPKSSSFEPKPNGIALLPDGSFLLAHLGSETGGVYRLTRRGKLTEFLTSVDNKPLPPTNFVHLDRRGRVWISISTEIRPRAQAYRPDVADGFIVLKNETGERVAARNLAYTNECVVDPTGNWLYLNETFGRCLSRYAIEEDGRLAGKETVTEFGAGVFPDGLTFDENGSVWITSIVSNRVIQVTPDGSQTVILEDCDSEHMECVETAFQNHCMGRPHLDTIKTRFLKNISSLAFGGEDLQTAYLGCLLDDKIASFHAPTRGAPPVHWEFDEGL